MSRSPSKHDRVAFIGFTSLAIAIVVGVWVWSVRAVVANGVAGAKETFSTIAETAGDVKTQSAPDPETVATVKAGLKGLLSPPSEESDGTVETVETDAAVDGIAELMKDDIDTYGETTGN